jgi:hypothetical protein
MKMKTSELTGAALDWVVAKCEKHASRHTVNVFDFNDYFFNPSTDWSQGGPIIEREGISIVQQGDAAEWVASVYNHDEDDWHLHATGPTPLIAAMRCYCASKLGHEVDVPDEIC